MSHELRTPLNAVIAFNSLALEEGNLAPTIREYLSASLTSASALLGIITQARGRTRNKQNALAIVRHTKYQKSPYV